MSNTRLNTILSMMSKAELNQLKSDIEELLNS